MHRNAKEIAYQMGFYENFSPATMMRTTTAVTKAKRFEGPEGRFPFVFEMPLTHKHRGRQTPKRAHHIDSRSNKNPQYILPPWGTDTLRTRWLFVHGIRMEKPTKEKQTWLSHQLCFKLDHSNGNGALHELFRMKICFSAGAFIPLSQSPGFYTFSIFPRQRCPDISFSRFILHTAHRKVGTRQTKSFCVA